MKNALLAILVMMTQSFWGQSAMFTIESPDSLGFELAVNGKSVSDSTIFSWSNVVEANSEVQLDLLVDLDSTTYISSTIKVDEMKHLTLQLISVGSGATLVEFSVVAYNVPVTSTDVDMVLEVDSLTNDSIPVIVLPEGCSQELSVYAHANLLQKLQEQFMDRQRMSLIEKETLNKCISVEQLRGMAVLIEFEDSRLDICQRLYQQVIDKEQYASLSDLFILSAHQLKLERLFQPQNPAQIVVGITSLFRFLT
jgi:hypothetical protein